PARHRRPRARDPQGVRLGDVQHHAVLHRGLPGADRDHRQRDHPAQGAGGRSLLRSDRDHRPQAARHPQADQDPGGRGRRGRGPGARPCRGARHQGVADTSAGRAHLRYGPTMSAFPLKRISPDGIPHALDKAERYRLLNDPAQAESICQDVLAVAPDNQDALRCLILSLTDQFGASGAGHTAREARTYIVKLTDEYERAYYSGLVHERETRAFLARKNPVRSAAYDGFRHAMEWYERAEALRPPGNVDAVLRWNS